MRRIFLILSLINILSAEVVINVYSNFVTFESDVDVGGFQMTLLHSSEDFTVTPTDNLDLLGMSQCNLLSENTTICIIVLPSTNELFSYSGDMIITDILVSNADGTAQLSSEIVYLNEIGGDINQDGILDILDIVLTVSIIMDFEYNELGDVNEDGILDILDIVTIVNWLVNGVSGCMDELACNYNLNATTDDGSCIYPPFLNFDCDGNCVVHEDCFGICGGSALVDCAGVCDGGAEYDADTNCCGDETPGCTGNCDGSYIDCTGNEGNEMDDNCCEPQTNNECLVILDDGDEQTQIDFCETNFSDNIILTEECELLNVATLDEFCEFHFGCATLDCAGVCAGGNTGIEYYDVCGCFDTNAINYYCNDGGICNEGVTNENEDILPCQDECIFSNDNGEFQSYNPDTYILSQINTFSQEETCCYDNYDNNVANGTCYDNTAANFSSPIDSCSDINLFEENCQYTNYLKIGTITDSTIEILINSSDEIGGFQFNVEDINISGAFGGSAASAGFEVATGPNGVLGFSLTGATIPSTNGEEEILTIISYIDMITTVCMPPSELLISGEMGIDLSDQFIIHYQSSNCP